MNEYPEDPEAIFDPQSAINLAHQKNGEDFKRRPFELDSCPRYYVSIGNKIQQETTFEAVPAFLSSCQYSTQLT